MRYNFTILVAPVQQSLKVDVGVCFRREHHETADLLLDPLLYYHINVSNICLQVSAWGGYVFIINLIPLHVFVLLVMGRYSNRLFTSYTTFYILGLLLSMQIPFVGFQPIRTSEHMAASGNYSAWERKA